VERQSSDNSATRLLPNVSETRRKRVIDMATFRIVRHFYG